ncbi:MAG TPA: sigma-70 family RNA polymerase sigma factor [Caulifigura sp.]|nr:sigma-70 family RNA polymerase sigma factor [Caulifigura sp.]
MANLTLLLERIDDGDPLAAEELLPLVYDELRRLAAARMTREAPGQTLQATALVHDAYIRLVDQNRIQKWENRGHFFAAAAEAMRRILVEQARRKRSLKRGGDAHRLELVEPAIELHPDGFDLLDLDQALDRFAAIDPEKARLVKLRYFGGLSIEETAGALGISVATAKRHWVYARAWLYGQLRARD